MSSRSSSPTKSSVAITSPSNAGCSPPASKSASPSTSSAGPSPSNSTAAISTNSSRSSFSSARSTSFSSARRRRGQDLPCRGPRCGCHARCSFGPLLSRRPAPARTRTGACRPQLRSRLAPDLLVLDDFGLHGLTPQQSENPYALIIERDRRSSFIVTSNRDVSETALRQEMFLGCVSKRGEPRKSLGRPMKGPYGVRAAGRGDAPGQRKSGSWSRPCGVPACATIRRLMLAALISTS